MGQSEEPSGSSLPQEIANDLNVVATVNEVDSSIVEIFRTLWLGKKSESPYELYTIQNVKGDQTPCPNTIE